MSTVVLVLNQEGITELIQIANDLQSKVDFIMDSGRKQPKDRIGNAGAATNFLEAAKEKLPMILEEDYSVKTPASNTSSKHINELVYLIFLK